MEGQDQTTEEQLLLLSRLLFSQWFFFTPLACDEGGIFYDFLRHSYR